MEKLRKQIETLEKGINSSVIPEDKKPAMRETLAKLKKELEGKEEKEKSHTKAEKKPRKKHKQAVKKSHKAEKKAVKHVETEKTKKLRAARAIKKNKKHKKSVKHSDTPKAKSLVEKRKEKKASKSIIAPIVKNLEHVEHELKQLPKHIEKLEGKAREQAIKEHHATQKKELKAHAHKSIDKFAEGGHVRGGRSLLVKLVFGSGSNKMADGGSVTAVVPAVKPASNPVVTVSTTTPVITAPLTQAAPVQHKEGGHPGLTIEKGFKMPHSYQIEKGTDKKKDYSEGVKHIDIKKGHRASGGYETERGKKGKQYKEGGAVKKGFVPRYGIFTNEEAAKEQAKKKNATIVPLAAKTVPAHTKKARIKKGKQIPEKHIKERHFPKRWMVVAKG